MTKRILAALALATLATSAPAADEPKKLVLIAGKPSHPPLMHEFRAGCLLLQKCLAGVEGLEVHVATGGWVEDDAILTDADAVVIYSDGDGRHPLMDDDHFGTLAPLIDKGMGFGCMHYAVQVPKIGKLAPAFQRWIGGSYEGDYSVNPIWSPKFTSYPKHPATRGVGPFVAEDEWYFNMRFVDGVAGNEPGEIGEGLRLLPILVDTPSDDVRDGPYVYPKGPYDHIIADNGRAETMLWTVERKGGGRGFGFTGGHFHLNWGNDDFRKVVLNTLLWVSGVDVPEGGVTSEVTEDELKENLDDKG